MAIHIIVFAFLCLNIDFSIKQPYKTIPIELIGLTYKNQKPKSKTEEKKPQNDKKNEILKNTQSINKQVHVKKTATPDAINTDFNKTFSTLKKKKQKKDTEEKEIKNKLDQIFQNKLLKNIQPSKNKKTDLNQETETSQSTESNQLSEIEINEIRDQIIPNWSIPTGIKGAESLVVQMLIRIDEIGNVIDIEILNMRDDHSFRIAAASTKRAIILSSPLKLTNKRFRNIREFMFYFDPKDAL